MWWKENSSRISYIFNPLLGLSWATGLDHVMLVGRRADEEPGSIRQSPDSDGLT